MAGAAAAAALASAALAGWASARSEAGLDALLAYANRMAAGDLTQLLSDVRGNAAVRRLARALTQTCVNVRSMVRDARTEVDGMSVSTHEIAAGNHDLSSRTESQASSLQQTAATMEQITGTVRQTAGTAERAKEIAARARGIARGSSEAVATVSRSMLDIQDASNRISEIIRTIDSIAFQTNILALNAAVEAARAGEQGKGFAVVASEVRALAQRSGHAAREIATLIQDSMQKVEAGTRSTQGAQASMSEALQAVEQVDTLIEEIHGGASEQLTGISQINSAIAQLDSITQQNAAMVEQLAASSTGLEARMHTVTSAVRVFRLDGDDAQPAPDAVALRRAAAHRATPHRRPTLPRSPDAAWQWRAPCASGSSAGCGPPPGRSPASQLRSRIGITGLGSHGKPVACNLCNREGSMSPVITSAGSATTRPPHRGDDGDAVAAVAQPQVGEHAAVQRRLAGVAPTCSSSCAGRRQRGGPSAAAARRGCRARRRRHPPRRSAASRLPHRAGPHRRRLDGAAAGRLRGSSTLTRVPRPAPSRLTRCPSSCANRCTMASPSPRPLLRSRSLFCAW